MDGLTIIPQVGLITSQISAQYNAQIIRLQRDVMTQQGENAIRLIQSALLPPYQGQNLDIKV